MKKIWKIVIIVAMLYLIGGILFWIYISISSVDRIYISEKNLYEQRKLCYDCFTGAKDGICPKIEYGSPKNSYPNAQEYKGEDLYMIGPYQGVHGCYWIWDNGFNHQFPQKSLAHSFKENWYNSWQGYFIWTLIIVTFGQLHM